MDIGLAPASALDQLGYWHYDRLNRMRANTWYGGSFENRILPDGAPGPVRSEPERGPQK